MIASLSQTNETVNACGGFFEAWVKVSEFMPERLCVFDVQTGQVFRNKAFREYRGIKEVGPLDASAVECLVHPEDREKDIAATDRALRCGGVEIVKLRVTGPKGPQEFTTGRKAIRCNINNPLCNLKGLERCWLVVNRVCSILVALLPLPLFL